MRKKTIIITGTPGTGKTTITKLLEKEKNILAINTTELAIKKGLVTEYDYKRKTYTIDEEKLKKEIEDTLQKTSKNIVIDTVYPCIIDTKYVTNIVVLRTHPEELENRLAKRGWPKIKINENIESELLNQVKEEALHCHPPQKIIEINTTHQKPEKIVDIIKTLLKD